MLMSVDAQFQVTYAGPHVTIQDLGRRGLKRFGVPASGPMDRLSLAIANAALGNQPTTPAVEVSLGGLSLDCVAGAVSVAVVGGGFIVQAGGQSLGSWSIFTIRAGEKLEIRPGPWGSWTYLAFAGNLEATCWLGSVATHSQSGFGGGKLVTGKTLRVMRAEIRENLRSNVPCPVMARPRHVVRVVLGPQDRFFSAAAIASLLGSRFSLTDSYDRMGVRLRGPLLTPQAALSIPSEAVLRGSMQVSGDGVATVLLADHQTTGGYPKIATIVSDDLDGFVQLRPHDGVVFKQVSPNAAVAQRRVRADSNAKYIRIISELRAEL